VTCMILTTAVLRNLRTSSENISHRHQYRLQRAGGWGMFVINNVDSKDYHSRVHFELALYSDCAYLYQFLIPVWGSF
jgi:hypothetical protein